MKVQLCYLGSECVYVCMCVCSDHWDRLWNADTHAENWNPQIIGFLGVEKHERDWSVWPEHTTAENIRMASSLIWADWNAPPQIKRK